MTQYKVGDPVVHLTHGVGRVVSVGARQLFGGEARLYYEVATQKSTVWVPVQSQVESTLRTVTAKADLPHYQQLLKGRPAALNGDRRQRHLELTERLRDGSFQSLCEAVRDLSAQGWRKPLGEADNALLRRLYDSLCQEWAAAAGLGLAETHQLVNALLFEAKRTHLTST